jgi:hypothetical protein
VGAEVTEDVITVTWSSPLGAVKVSVASTAVAAVGTSANVRAEVTEDVITVTWSSPLGAVKVSVASTAVAVVIVVKNGDAGGFTTVRATVL